MSDLDVTTLSDEELRSLETSLAQERTRIRIQQNAVQAELEIRAFMKGLSGAAKQELRARLLVGGEVKPTGEAK